MPSPSLTVAKSQRNRRAHRSHRTLPRRTPGPRSNPGRAKPRAWTRLLLFIIIGVPLIYLGLMPFRPWMLVHAPVVQEFINGAKTSIVAAAAYARVGEIPLWLVIGAGFIGMAKLDWAFWLAGRRWGDGVLRLFAQNERQLKRINQLKKIPNWALFLMTVISRCPGIPGTLVYLVAGWTRMRLSPLPRRRPPRLPGLHPHLDRAGLPARRDRRRRPQGHRQVRAVADPGAHRRHLRLQLRQGIPQTEEDAGCRRQLRGQLRGLTVRNRFRPRTTGRSRACAADPPAAR